VVAAAVGGAVLMLVIALVLGALGWWPGSGASAPGPSGARIVLPARLGDYPRYQDNPKNQDPRAASNVAFATRSDSATAAQLSAAYAGAPTAVEYYADASLANFFSVYAIRAHTPDLVVQVEDADRLGAAVPTRRVEHIGDVSCIVFYDFVAKNNPVPPTSVHTIQCQRTSGALTVIVIGIQGDLAHNQGAVAGLFDQACSTIG
jgi:hypothetical protein